MIPGADHNYQESLESPVEPFPGSAWLGAGQALGKQLFSKAGLGTRSEREVAYRGPNRLPLLPSTLSLLPQEGTKS